MHLGSWNHGDYVNVLDKRSGVIAAVATGIYWMCFESLGPSELSWCDSDEG